MFVCVDLVARDVMTCMHRILEHDDTLQSMAEFMHPVLCNANSLMARDSAFIYANLCKNEDILKIYIRDFKQIAITMIKRVTLRMFVRYLVYTAYRSVTNVNFVGYTLDSEYDCITIHRLLSSIAYVRIMLECVENGRAPIRPLPAIFCTLLTHGFSVPYRNLVCAVNERDDFVIVVLTSYGCRIHPFLIPSGTSRAVRMLVCGRRSLDATYDRRALALCFALCTM